MGRFFSFNTRFACFQFSCVLARFLLFIGSLLFSPLAWSVACDAVFTNGVQSHSSTGSVNAGYQAEINGGGGLISTPELIQQSSPGQAICDSGTCQATGYPSTPSSVAVLQSNGSSGSVTASGGNTNINAGQYVNITVPQRVRATFNSEGGEYRMRAFSTGYQSEVRFRSGDYWITGDMTLGQETEVTKQGGNSDPVRIFVDGDVVLGYDMVTSGFSPGQLFIYATGSITVRQFSAITGFLYADGLIITEYQVVINGALSAEEVQLAQETIVSYPSAIAPDLDYTPFCDPTGGTPATLIADWRMDEAGWSGTAGEVIDSSGNGNNATAQNGADTADVAPALSGDPGTCGYGEFDGVDDYLSVPGLSGTLNRTASMAFWIKTTQTGNSTAWSSPAVAGIEENGGADDIFWGWLNPQGRIGLTVGNNNTTVSNAQVSTGNWTHVALTRNHESGEYQIFINGALDSRGTTGTGIIGNGFSSIGRVENTSSSVALNYLQAQLDEVRIYEGVLTEPEVQAIFQARHPCSQSICPTGTPVPGLFGEFYNNMNLAGAPEGTRVDGPVDFNWGLGGPGVAGVGDDEFSVRWSGRLHITQTGGYRFQTRSDDGVRLRVDGDLVIDEWAPQPATNDTSGVVNLEAGQSYDIELEYFEEFIDSEIRLRWDAPGATSGFVPIPVGNANGTATGLYHCPGNRVDSYTLVHANNGVTCEALPVVITARDSAGNAVVPAAGTVVDLLADPVPDSGDTAWVGDGTYVFSGSENNFTAFLRQLSPAEVGLSVTDGTASGSSGPVNFADTGLVFYGDRSGGPLPNQVAGTEDLNPVIRAVRTDDETGSCEARVDNQTRTVQLGYECINPGSCRAGQTLSLASTFIQANNAGAGPAYSPVSLGFDDEGYADIPLEYSDVGDIRLWAQLSLPEEGEQPAVDLVGQSNRFIVKPHTLVVTDVQGAAGQSNPGGTGSGAGFVASGEPFSVRVEARNSNGAVTPNFGNESPAQSVRLELSELVYPSGGSLGNLGGAGSLTREDNGVALGDGVSWDNVGTITLEPRLVGDDYLGAGDLVEVTESDPVGRFYPYDYTLNGSTASDACGPFSYMHQAAIDLSYTVSARNLNGAVVSNYDDTTLAYAGTANPGYVAENDDAANGSELSGRVQAENEADWSGGVLTVTDSSAAFLRASNTRPDGPRADLQWGLTLMDSLDGRPMVDLDMNANTSGDCAAAGNCSAVALGDPLNLRFGRLRLNDAFGPEVVDLPVPFYTEYWNGSEFVRNVDDSCTRIPRDAINYQPTGDLVDDSNRTVPIGGGSTTGQYADLDGVGVNFSSSDADHYFTAPGEGNTGSFDIELDLTNRPWLRFDWNQDGDFLNDIQMPPANIGFGSYRGHDRIIYWREVLE